MTIRAVPPASRRREAPATDEEIERGLRELAVSIPVRPRCFRAGLTAPKVETMDDGVDALSVEGPDRLHACLIPLSYMDPTEVAACVRCDRGDDQSPRKEALLLSRPSSPGVGIGSTRPIGRTGQRQDPSWPSSLAPARACKQRRAVRCSPLGRLRTGVCRIRKCRLRGVAGRAR